MDRKLFAAAALAFCLTPGAGAATFTVTNGNDTGPGSLRQAILDANATVDADMIAFAMPAGTTISIGSALPIITQPVTVDGTTQGPGRVVIVGYGRCFIIDAADTTIRGFHLLGHDTAIEVRGTWTGRKIAGNLIGHEGTAKLSMGIYFPASYGAPLGHTVIGGTTSADRNVIYGYEYGVWSFGGTGVVIQGNYIGVAENGVTPVGNRTGIYSEELALIGGTAPGAGNVIAGNEIGVDLWIGPDYISVLGNLIGVAADGVTPAPNGIGIRAVSVSRIGGLASGEGNVIAYNTVSGIDMTHIATSNLSNSVHHNKTAIRRLDNWVVQRAPLNDAGDADRYTNRPVIAGVTASAGGTVIRGRLHGTAGTAYTLQFFANQDAASQGKTLLGTTTVTPGADHEAQFETTVAAATGCCITATASRPGRYAPATPATSFYSRGFRVRRDFNGDFKSDIWWRNSINGENAIWFMDGHRVIGGRNLPPVGPEWQAIVADYDSDGQSDVFWRHTVTGENAVWYLKNGYINLQSSFSPPAMPVEWEPVAIDADDDGLSELLWRNVTTGEQQLSRAVYSYPWWAASVAPMPGDWKRTALPMDLTGFDSVLWRSDLNAATQVWQMDTNIVAGGGSLPPVGDQWEMLAGDFNGDTNADILWRHKATGQLSMWLLRGTAIIGGGDLYPVGTPWEPILGDFNGDGKCDVIWHRSDTGQSSLWLLDGWRIIGGGDAPYVPGSQWSAVP